MKRLLKNWLLSLLGFGALALVLGAKFVASTAATWQIAGLSALRDWLPWVFFTPLLFLLVASMPLDRRRWKSTLLVHLACCFVTLVACDQWAKFIDPNFKERHTPRPVGPTFDPNHLIRFYLPIYIAVVASAHARLFYHRSQEREASLALARLETLKMQLQPHFLFNTLNMIAELVYKEPERADAMLTALSDLLRITLETSRTRIVPLRRELEFVERYLAIMHARFEERLRFELDIAPETSAALVPTLSLQPLVENAVEHGVKDCAENGLITIRSWLVGSVLHLSVADNGVGLPKTTPLREGIGLGNIRSRLRELYGKNAALEIRESDGVIVEITLPFRAAS